MKIISTSLLFALFCYSAVFSINLEAQTQLYQWVDANGVKHFSQQPPPEELDLEPTDINGAPVISGGEPQDFLSTRTAEPTTPEPTQTAASEQPVQKKDASRCNSAKETISTLTNAPRVRVLDEETGEYRYIDNDEKQKQLESWRKEQSTYC